MSELLNLSALDPQKDPQQKQTPLAPAVAPLPFDSKNQNKDASNLAKDSIVETPKGLDASKAAHSPLNNTSPTPLKGDALKKESPFSQKLKGWINKVKPAPKPTIQMPRMPQVLTPEPLSRTYTPTPQAVPQATPQAVPQATPQAVPQATPQAVPQATPQAVPQATPQVLTPQAIPQAAPQKNLKVSAAPNSGNLFTRMFKGSELMEGKNSIIDTIVNKTDAEKAKAKEAKKALKLDKKQLKKSDPGQMNFKMARLFFYFSVLFIFLGTPFLYIQIIDVNNSVFAWFNGPENYASRLHELQSELDILERQEGQLSGEVTRFKEGYKDPSEAVIKEILKSRSNWPQIQEQLDAVSEKLYPLNAFFGYLEYTNFNLNFETKQVSFSATLKDPNGNNFSALARFERLLKAYPGDPDEADGIKPYFTDIQEINNYSERYNATTNTYETVFSMSAKINMDLL